MAVLDLRLPDTDGIDLLRQLRRSGRTWPVIITSAYVSLEPQLRVLDLPHHGYLVKPFDLDDLARRIDDRRLSAPLVEARGLTRRYGAVRALRGVDLDLAAGEVLLVLGPNGAGQDHPAPDPRRAAPAPGGNGHGSPGRALSRDDPDARRAIGLLSHQSLLYDELTLLENLVFAARLYGLPRPGRRAEAALEAQGLAERADDRPRQPEPGHAAAGRDRAGAAARAARSCCWTSRSPGWTPWRATGCAQLLARHWTRRSGPW